jgi:hypothetical protein
MVSHVVRYLDKLHDDVRLAPHAARLSADTSGYKTSKIRICHVQQFIIRLGDVC